MFPFRLPVPLLRGEHSEPWILTHLSLEQEKLAFLHTPCLISGSGYDQQQHIWKKMKSSPDLFFTWCSLSASEQGLTKGCGCGYLLHFRNQFIQSKCIRFQVLFYSYFPSSSMKRVPIPVLWQVSNTGRVELIHCSSLEVLVFKLW